LILPTKKREKESARIQHAAGLFAVPAVTVVVGNRVTIGILFPVLSLTLIRITPLNPIPLSALNPTSTPPLVAESEAINFCKQRQQGFTWLSECCVQEIINEINPDPDLSGS